MANTQPGVDYGSAWASSQDTHTPDRTLPVEDYSEVTVRDQHLDDQTTDALEDAVAAMITGIIVGHSTAAPAEGLASLLEGLEVPPDVLASALQPVIAPSVYVIVRRMLRRIPHSDSYSRDELNETISRTVDRHAVTLRHDISKKSDHLLGIRDMHKRIRQSDILSPGSTPDLSHHTGGPPPEQPPYDGTPEETIQEVREWARAVSRTIITDLLETVKTEVAERTGLTHKRWLTRMDERVRVTHRELEGESRELHDVFTVMSPRGSVSLKYPGDPDAPLSERINCRCRLLWY